LSGTALESAGPPQLLDYAGALVRSEAALGESISEMNVAQGDTFSLFLERSRTELIFDLANTAVELEHAAYLLRRWRGHRDLIAALDMTTTGEAVMKLRAALPIVGDGAVAAAAHRTFEPSAGSIRPWMRGLAAR